MATKNTQQYRLHNHFVIATGYTLFALTLVTFIFQDIIPLGHALTTPHVRMINTWAFLVSLSIALLLPPIIAYIAGSTSTRNRNLQMHHYNGVLFALLACWLVALIDTVDASWITAILNAQDPPVSTLLTFSLPVACVAVVVGVLAYFYHRGRKKQPDLLEYRPFQVSVLASAVGVLAGMAVSMATNWSDALLGVWMLVAVVGGVFGLTYVGVMRLRASTMRKFLLAIIGITLAGATAYVVAQVLTGPRYTSLPGMAGCLAGLLVWLLYLYITRQSYGLVKAK